MIKKILDIKPADIKSSVHGGDSSREKKKSFNLHSPHFSHNLECKWDLKRKQEFGSLSKKQM